jgi:transposase-like protein
MTQSIKRYSEAFRRQVVSEYEDGSSVSALQKKYGITGNETIQKWVKKYSNQGLRTGLIRIQTVEEACRVKALEQQVAELERALARTTLEKLRLESMVEELQLLHGEEEVKKNGAPSSPASNKNARQKRAGE